MEWRLGYRQQIAFYLTAGWKLLNTLRDPNKGRSNGKTDNEMERGGTPVYNSYQHSALKSINITYIHWATWRLRATMALSLHDTELAGPKHFFLERLETVFITMALNRHAA